jgi:hypothetical protein
MKKLFKISHPLGCKNMIHDWATFEIMNKGAEK